MSKNKISNIKGRMVFDSRGKPTIEAEITVNGKISGSSIAPSGASTGKKEAIEKRDNKNDFFGESVNNNILLINTIIKENLVGFDIEDQEGIDNKLIKLDGTLNKSFLGANTTIAVSMAVLKTAAISNKTSLWSYLSLNSEKKIPLPEVQIIGGGAHAKGSIPIQDFMIIPNGAPNFYSALEWVFKVYRKAGERLLAEKKLFGVADEGGYWPFFNNIEEVLIFLTETIEQSGLKPLKEVSISLDIAANNFKYKNGYKLFEDQKCINNNIFKKQLLKWINMYPIISIEDPFAEEDIDLFSDFKLQAPSYLQIVGDDLVVTNPELIKLAHKKKAINTVLIKPNQIGTISETYDALKQSEKLNLHTILSARSGETEDNFISDLSIGWNIKQLKVGSFSRSERLSKWNQCLRVAEDMNNNFAMHTPPNLWDKF